MIELRLFEIRTFDQSFNPAQNFLNFLLTIEIFNITTKLTGSAYISGEIKSTNLIQAKWQINFRVVLRNVNCISLMVL